MPSNQHETSIDFKAKQQEFAAYIRNPHRNPAPADVPPERMAMYRQLFYNNIDSFLAANFPVLRKLLSDSQWTELTEDFFAKHTNQSPYFSEIPEEFLAYLENERQHPDDFPFMLELAHYEWVEMALSIAKDELTSVQSPDNLLQANIKLSPLAWSLAYQYPVHKIAPGFLPEQPPAQPTFLVVYRDPADDVNFIEITPMTYRLLEIIEQSEGIQTETALKQVAEELRHPNPELIISGGLQILRELMDKSVIISV
ncbi:MAG: putative DNA-binding domain-containing protein [Methylobacter sp.]|nr:putative DNA-binding domain-containing protein [Methylobacter sp.]